MPAGVFGGLGTVIVALAGLAAAGSFRSDPAPYLSDKDLLRSVRRGGTILFLRHPQTEPDQADTDPLHLENVAAQRQLSEEGRQTARALGRAFRDLKIPVARVLASKFRRATEAARLLDVGEVETSMDIAEGGLVVSPNENRRREKALRALLSTPPHPGKNIVIVSHKPNLQDAAGKEFGDAAEGEVFVFRPLAGGGFTCLGRVPAARWTAWAEESKNAPPPRGG